MAGKKELVSDYEARFVQVREAVESEKENHDARLRDLAERIDEKELAMSRVEERLKQMAEERA